MKKNLFHKIYYNLIELQGPKSADSDFSHETKGAYSMEEKSYSQPR